MNASQDYISHRIDISKALDADFNLPKIHVMSHCAEKDRQYRTFQHDLAEGYEQVHKRNLKYGRNAANHNLNYLPQVITFQRRILFFEIRDLNVQALAPRQEKSTVACKVLRSGADLAAPLSPHSYAKPEFIGPQNSNDGKHPDAMIKDFRAVLDNTQDATQRTVIYSGTLECIKHKSHIKTYILHEQLHAIELCI
jgi:hypothetical protein